MQLARQRRAFHDASTMSLRILPALVLASASLHAADLYFPPPDSAGGWREATTEKACRDLGGMDL
ncbi:MAG: hypothetical protein B7Z47_04700, partial [Chthoniobacter sp. 12-60-6]